MARARAKNIARTEARRKTRVDRSSQLADADSGDIGASGDDPAATAAATARRGFRMPDVRADLRALPDIFRTQRLLWIPFVVLLAGFLIYCAWTTGILANDVNTAGFVAIVVNLVLTPNSLILPLVAGFLAPRAAYLVGFVLGVAQAILISIAAILSINSSVAAPDGSTDVTTGGEVTLAAIISISVASILLSTGAAAFAAWYRGFLRNSQERARVSRVERDKQNELKRKEAEREARRSASMRPTTQRPAQTTSQPTGKAGKPNELPDVPKPNVLTKP